METIGITHIGVTREAAYLLATLRRFGLVDFHCHQQPFAGYEVTISVPTEGL